MRITCDPAKRELTLAERGLDFMDAVHVFAGAHFTGMDEREDYGEDRYVTVGYLSERMVIVVWTPRGEARHVISMRKANEREIRRYRQQLEANRRAYPVSGRVRGDT